MIEQEHFKHYEANDTFIHRQDWPKVDELIDWLIQKNESGYKMVRCGTSNLCFPIVPQSCVADYMGKHGARVPSTLIINEFWPALQFQGSTFPRRKSFISCSRFTEFTIL